MRKKLVKLPFKAKARLTQVEEDFFLFLTHTREGECTQKTLSDKYLSEVMSLSLWGAIISSALWLLVARV